VIDFIEAGFDVCLKHPMIVLGAGGQMVDLGDRVMRAPVLAEPIGARLEVRLKDGLEH
jgi:hypothetical protein